MKDPFGRHITYLRLSVTELCNLFIVEGKHNLAVCTLVAYNCEKAHCNIVNAVFAVKHCCNGHCGVDTAEKAFADMAY